MPFVFQRGGQKREEKKRIEKEKEKERKIKNQDKVLWTPYYVLVNIVKSNLNMVEI